MTSFEKGYTYLVNPDNSQRWYIVRQISMKGWVAVEFASHNIPENMRFHQANGKSLYELFGECEINRYVSNSEMRRDMFSILKYGRIEE